MELPIQIKSKNNRRAILWTLIALLMMAGIIGVIFKRDKINHPEYYKKEESTEKMKCVRSEPYEISEEFRRALSLRSQRLKQAGLQVVGEEFFNCLNIQYADLRLVGGAEGGFNEANSSPEDLKIYIDNIYVFNEDLLIALVLQHEIKHAEQYLEQIKTGVSRGCLERETEAFLSESELLRALNDGEKQSIISQIRSLELGKFKNEYSYKMIESINNLLDSLQGQSIYCGKENIKGTKEYNECLRFGEKEIVKIYLKHYRYCE